MGDDFLFQLEGRYRENADAVRIPCLLNIAACMLKLKRYNEAIANCNAVSSWSGGPSVLYNLGACPFFPGFCFVSFIVSRKRSGIA